MPHFEVPYKTCEWELMAERDVLFSLLWDAEVTGDAINIGDVAGVGLVLGCVGALSREVMHRKGQVVIKLSRLVCW